MESNKLQESMTELKLKHNHKMMTAIKEVGCPLYTMYMCYLHMYSTVCTVVIFISLSTVLQLHADQ